jgi:intracellular sulfur oxidation DsrE/DsrF family protein
MNLRLTYMLLGGLTVAWICLLGMLPVAAAEMPGPDDKPFAEAHIVLQLSDGDEAVQARVLNVASNLLKHYGGPDLVDLEIVAFGPGISLLYADSAQSARLSSLATMGVRFMACMNTVETIERTTGKRPELNPLAIPVQAGVAHIVERSTQGFVVVRP